MAHFPGMRLPLVLMFLAGSASLAAADECDLNGKTISAGVVFCGIENSQNTCHKLDTKIQIVGDKFLYYDNIAEATGLVFHANKTIDVLTDPQQQRLPPSPDPRMGFGATVTATTEENQAWHYIFLELRETTWSVRTGRLLSSGGFKLKLSVQNCSSCSVSYYNNYNKREFIGGYVTNMNMTDQSCQIN